MVFTTINGWIYESDVWLGNCIPTAADYDSDGRADIAVFRSGNWYLNRTTGGFIGIRFGTATDKPIPNAFVG